MPGFGSVLQHGHVQDRALAGSWNAALYWIAQPASTNSKHRATLEALRCSVKLDGAVGTAASVSSAEWMRAAVPQRAH